MILENNESRLSDYERPEDGLSLKEINEMYGNRQNWMATMIRFISGRWAQDDHAYYFGMADPDRRFGTDAGGREWNRVDRILHNYMYYFGRQRNFSYSHLMQDPKGNKNASPHIKGDDVYDMVNHLIGGVNRLIGSANVTVRSLDPEVMSKRMNKINRLRVKQEMKGFFADLAKSGFEYLPEGNRNVTADQRIKELQESATDNLELFGIDMLKDFENKNPVKTQMGQLGLHTAIGDASGIEIIDDDIRMRTKVVPAYSLVTDDQLDNDFGYHQTYVGKVEHKTLNQILTEYELKDDEIALLRKHNTKTEETSGFLANANTVPFGAIPNFQWWGTADAERKIQVVTAYWVANKKDEDGSINTTAFQGTLIGNMILTNAGEMTNIVWHRDDPNMPVLPIIVCKPGTILGRNVGPVERLKKLQDYIDAVEVKIAQSIARDKGKGHVFKGALVGQGSDKLQIATDLEQLGIHVTGKIPADEMMLLGQQKMVDVVDMSLDPNVVKYIELIKERRELMRMRISASKVSMGQQTTYIGLETQQNTIARNNLGAGVFYDTVIQTYVNVLWFAYNKLKVFLLDEENAKEAETIWGDRQKNFMELVKRFQSETMQIYVGIEDIIDEKARERILAIAHDQAQNFKESGFTILDYLACERENTFTELYNYFEKRLQSIKNDRDQRMAAEAMMQNIKEAKQMSIQNDHKNKDRAAGLEMARIKAGAKNQQEVAEPAG